MKFSVDFLDYKMVPVFKETIDEGRWMKTVRVVFECDGKYYSCEQVRGLTEMQDVRDSGESEWGEDEDGLVECVEVEQRDVVVSRWLPVSKED